MSSPKAPQMDMVPIIDSAALPHTSAHEWAEGTSSALQSKLDDQSAQPIHSLNTGSTGPAPVSGGTRVTTPPFISMASSTSTPGNEFPGAYPRDNAALSGGGASAVETAKDAAYQMYESAKQYMPAPEDIQQTLENATTTAKQYLPASVGAYLPDGKAAVSLPSQEVYGNMGTSSDGVGALPGTLSEVSVAKLPEERRLEGLSNAKTFGATYAREQAWTHSSSGGVGDLPGGKFESGVAILPDERLGRTIGGLGDLPESKHETEVARLPEEKAVEGDFTAFLSNSPPVVTTTNKRSAINENIDSFYGQSDPDASHMTLPPTPGSNGSPVNHSILPPAIPSTGNEFARASAGGVINSGFGHVAQSVEDSSDAHDAATLGAVKAAGVIPMDAQGPMVPSKTSNISERVANGKPDVHKGEPRRHILEETEKMNNVIREGISEAATTGHGSEHGRTASQTESRRKSHDLPASQSDTKAASGSKDRSESMSSSSSKPSFMDKVKGEVKVISGKLGRNDEKVEEGRRMMGKD